MSVEGQNFYPGEEATAEQIFLLAGEYRRAADTLLPTGRRRMPLSRAPYRLVAIQAIELYFNALLIKRVLTAAKLRGLQHDLAARTRLAPAAGLFLRKGTVKHLQGLSETREYLISRYCPEKAGSTSELNRLAATLLEVAEKVTAILKRYAE